MNVSCLTAYTIVSYIDCINDLGLSPYMEVKKEPYVDRKTIANIPQLSPKGYSVPENLSACTGLIINLGDDNFNSIDVDYKYGVITLKQEGVDSPYIFPVENIVSIRTADREVEFDCLAEGVKFIAYCPKPNLRLVK